MLRALGTVHTYQFTQKVSSLLSADRSSSDWRRHDYLSLANAFNLWDVLPSGWQGAKIESPAMKNALVLARQDGAS